MKRTLGIVAALIAALTWLDALLLGRMQGDLRAAHERENLARWGRPAALDMDEVLRGYGADL